MTVDPRVHDLCKILNSRARGPDNAISSGELADEVGIKDGEANPKTRKLVKDVMRFHRVPIASNGDGYFVPTNKQQEREEVESIDRRISQIEERKKLFREACDSDSRITDLEGFADV